MNKAIITGATGLIGKAVAKYFIENSIDVLCLGRKPLSTIEIENIFGSNTVKYIQIEMEEILSLPDEIVKINWIPGDSCVFYNFAWSGIDKLTNGEFVVQFKNAINSSKSVLTAKKLGCTKFINVGTMEETLAELFINKYNDGFVKNSSQKNYAISKLASRDMCKMVSYLEKIDYIHTRLSAPIDSDLSRGGYISSVLTKIKEGKEYEKPKNNQFFDFISLEEVAKAYFLIGLKGKNKADYFIGSSNPMTLKEFFELSDNYKKGKIRLELLKKYNSKKHEKIYNTEKLANDTGFYHTGNLSDFIKKVLTI